MGWTDCLLCSVRPQAFLWVPRQREALHEDLPVQPTDGKEVSMLPPALTKEGRLWSAKPVNVVNRHRLHSCMPLLAATAAVCCGGEVLALAQPCSSQQWS